MQPERRSKSQPQQAARANELLSEMMTNWSPDKEAVLRFEGDTAYIQHYRGDIDIRQLQERLLKLGITTEVNFNFCG